MSVEPEGYSCISTPPCTDDVIELGNKISSRRKASSENNKNPGRKYFKQLSEVMNLVSMRIIETKMIQPKGKTALKQTTT